MLTTGDRAEPLNFINLEIQEKKISGHNNNEKMYLAHEWAGSSRLEACFAQKIRASAQLLWNLYTDATNNSLWDMRRIKIVSLLCFFIVENTYTFF